MARRRRPATALPKPDRPWLLSFQCNGGRSGTSSTTLSIAGQQLCAMSAAQAQFTPQSGTVNITGRGNKRSFKLTLSWLASANGSGTTNSMINSTFKLTLQ